MKIEIEIYERCGSCCDGIAYDFKTGRDKKCEVCKGTGEILTEIGWDIVRLIREVLAGDHK